MWVRIPLFSFLRLPNHIILDFNNQKNNHSSSYWVDNFFTKQQNNTPLFLRNRLLSDKISSDATLTLLTEQYNSVHIGYKLNNFSSINYTSNHLNTLNSLINVNFLRKERLYTKLKYSRSPAFDIVSGGAAAIFAGLLGFLVSEKFGLELVDSGDFYYLFMYAVFIAFSVRPLLVVMSNERSFAELLSFRRIIVFYKNILLLILKLFK